MPDDPSITYRGPESTSQEILAIMFSGAAVTVRGVVVLFETSAGEAGAPFADAGAVAWIAYDGDPAQIEFVQYVEPATGQRVHRRVTKAERVSSQWNTVKLNMGREATVIAQRADFDGRDFNADQFATGLMTGKSRSRQRTPSGSRDPSTT